MSWRRLSLNCIEYSGLSGVSCGLGKMKKSQSLWLELSISEERLGSLESSRHTSSPGESKSSRSAFVKMLSIHHQHQSCLGCLLKRRFLSPFIVLLNENLKVSGPWISRFFVCLFVFALGFFVFCCCCFFFWPLMFWESLLLFFMSSQVILLTGIWEMLLEVDGRPQQGLWDLSASLVEAE